MDKKIEPVDIIDLLAYQEYKLALLYNLFADLYPECSDLWASMAIDEIEHQRLIRSLKPYVDEGRLYFNAMLSKVEFVEGHLKTLEGLILRFEKTPVGIQEALEIALNIENSMLDQDLFAYFFGDGKILKNGLEMLTRDTQKHYNSLVQEVQRIGTV
jgi:hypothetical protein